MSAERYVSTLEEQADRELAIVQGIAKPRPKPQEPQKPQAPEPLRRPVAPAQTYPIDALGSVLGDAVRAVHSTVRSPVALAGNSALAAAALAVQPHADVVVDGRRKPTSVFVVSIGESGERKSGTDEPLLSAHREFERTRFVQYSIELTEHRVEVALYQAGLSATAKIKDEHQRRHAMRELGDAPEAPLIPNLVCSEPTLEGLHRLLMGGIGSVGLFSDEGGQFFGGHAMAKEHVAKTAAGLSSLWDSGRFDRVRAGDGASTVFGKRLSAHLMLQPVIAERVLSDPVLSGQGFLARCLTAWPDSTAGTRLYVERDLTEAPAMGRYWSRMTALLQKPMPILQGTRNEIQPRGLKLTPPAKRAWIAIHDTIEQMIGGDGEYSPIRAHASKAAEQVLRVAGVLAVVEDPDAGEIGPEIIDRAGAIVDFHLSEVGRLVGMSEVSPEVRKAEAVLRWCHERGKRLTHSSELLKFGPGCIRERRHLTAAMDELQRAGWAIPVEGGAEIDGAHRRHAWRIVEG